jgi:hypothetical protein
VIFGQDSNELVLPLEDFRRNHEGLDPHLFPILQDHVARSLAQAEAPRSFTEAVAALQPSHGRAGAGSTRRRASCAVARSSRARLKLRASSPKSRRPPVTGSPRLHSPCRC